MCLNAKIKDPSWLSHMLYEHLNFGDIKFLSKQQLVKVLPFIDHSEQPCKECLLGKHYQNSFPKELTFRASNLYNLFIHMFVAQSLQILFEETNTL